MYITALKQLTRNKQNPYIPQRLKCISQVYKKVKRTYFNNFIYCFFASLCLSLFLTLCNYTYLKYQPTFS